MQPDGSMFIGAYWEARAEARRDAADRIAGFLRLPGMVDDQFSTWNIKANGRGAADRPVDPTPIGIEALLTENRRDDDKQPIPELGFSFAAWNGRGVSLNIGIGKTSPHVLNSVVISFESAKVRDSSTRHEILRAAIETFDPDRAVATSDEILERSGASKPWHPGWLTYISGGDITEHSLIGLRQPSSEES